MGYRACFGALVLCFAQVATAQTWQRPQVQGQATQVPPAQPSRAVACEPNLGGSREVAGLTVSEQEYQDVLGRVQALAGQFVAVAKDPHSTIAADLNASFSRDRHAQERASTFIRDNNLFNRYVATGDGETINPAMNQVRGSMDDFIANLDQLKGLTGKKVKALRLLSKIPGSKFVIGPNPISRVVTINQHIEQIGTTIDNGIQLMKGNIVELGKLQDSTVTEIHAMEREIVYMDMLTREIERAYQEDPEFQQNPQLVERMQFQVLRRLETHGLDQKGLLAVLMASTEGIKHQVEVHRGVIENANSLRRVAAPAIGITLAVRLAAEDAKKVINDNQRIRNEVRESISMMTSAIQDTNAQLIQLYKEEVLPAEFMAAEMKKIDVARQTYDSEMRKIYETKRAQNAKFDPVLRNGMRVLEAQSVGAKMDSILSNDGADTPQIPRPRR